MDDIAAAAHALAYVVIAARRHTDVFEWGQRTTPFSLAAEIQRRLLPSSYTCEAGHEHRLAHRRLFERSMAAMAAGRRKLLAGVDV